MRNALLVFLIALAPVAAAAPEPACSAGLVCTSESSYGDNCDEFGGGVTVVSVAGGQIVAGGSYYCYPGGGGSDAFVYAPGTSVYWGEFHYSDPENGEFRGCFIFVGDQYVAPPSCDVGSPPNPGWGNLLP